MNYADKWTDENLKLLEKKIFKLYSEAQKDFESLSKEYFENFAERDKEYSKLVENEEITQEEYKQWRLNQIGRGERIDEMAAKMAERATTANEVAVAYVNDLTPSVYSLNRNHEAYVIESLGHEMVGADFTLYNEAAVRRMVVEDSSVMPYYPKKKAVARNIDLAYGQKVIKNKVTSGILQGKSVYEISDDLQKDLTTMSRTSAVRAARTAVTSAQNGGKMASMTAALNMGIKLRKRWVATKDARTRDVHAEADGQTVEIDKPFEVGGEKLMFPGDSSASGWNLYNCRCTMRTVEKDGIEAEPRQMRVRNPETGEWELVSDMSYQEWAALREVENKTAWDLYIKKGKNISADEKQWKEYKSALGKEVPNTLDKFQSMKYNEPEKWKQLQGYKRYKGRVPEATVADYSAYKAVKTTGIIGSVRVPPEKITVSNLAPYDEHAIRHGCTLEDAKGYVKAAKCSIRRKRWDGESINYYSLDGATYIDPATMKIKTAFSEKDFDTITNTVVEVFRK